VYGVIDDAETARRERFLPMGLSRGARVARAIPEDGLVRLEDVSLDTSSLLFRLWQEQVQLSG
jgi:predicted homoserine dehydrogenase-like protein